ncbi:MAG: PH domain-containing protein [Mycobacterium sp.]
MAHLAVGFLTLGLLIPVLTWPTWAPALLVIPIFLSALIVRLRTVADAETVTARTLLSSRTVAWQDVDGLRFEKGSWARAVLTSADDSASSELRLPAVTFAMLPLLTDVTDGRVPNPYS